MGKVNVLRMICLALMCCITVEIPSTAQTVSTLATFDFTDGQDPDGLVQGTDGNFYGTTVFGGTSKNCTQGCGTVFKVSPSGMLTSLHSFDGTDGSSPSAGLVLGSDGNFYGTTANGGANNNCPSGCGTVFKITAKGALTTLHSFNGTDGSYGYWLVQGTNGNFYGTTAYGGSNNNCTDGCGTVFKITAKGNLTTLHNFNGTDGFSSGGLVLGNDGNFYGTTFAGGANNNNNCPSGCGTVFKITAKGKLTTLHSFNGTDGIIPTSMVQGTDGNFYGVTETGGLDFGGTVFKITANGILTTPYNFPLNSVPGGVVQGTDGNFYGTTQAGGFGLGTIFQITSMGVYTLLYNFGTNNNDGSGPYPGPVQGTDGTFYGTTSYGANNIYGTVYSLSMGLGQFIETLPNSGKIEKQVIILGNDLTGASGVSFNGTAATFKVISSTKITTKVPTGATTGLVTVTTPNGTLTSNIQFVVP